MKFFRLFLLLVLLLPSSWVVAGPKLAVVFVVDQFAHHYLRKIRPHLKGGIAKLLDKGVVYNNAVFPHGMPSTPTGHAALSTGTYGYIHGITGYGLVDKNNNYTLITHDNSPESAEFSLTGTYDYGKSARNLMVDTLCDQFALTSEPGRSAEAYAISLKDRASVFLAGSKGKALWFDYNAGRLTSSKAYFDEFPEWLEKFNENKKISEGKTFTWKPRFKLKSVPYCYNEVQNYQNCARGTLIDIPFTIDSTDVAPFRLYERTPFANSLLIDAGIACVKNHFKENKNNRMLLWISLSSLDFAGHYFGPDCREQLDMLYHLDRQIGEFMNTMEKVVSTKDTVYILTADHGVMPIPEVLNAKGFVKPIRIDANELIQKIDIFASEEYGIKNIVKVFEAPQFFLNKAELSRFSSEKQIEIIYELKEFVEAQPGIKHCWTLEDLKEPTKHKDCYKKLFAKQMFEGRAGELTCFLHPYYMLTKYPTGTSHATPYRYDVHVPLVIYQPKRHERKLINNPVSMLQLAGSLADILEVPRPSAAVKTGLPGLF